MTRSTLHSSALRAPMRILAVGLWLATSLSSATVLASETPPATNRAFSSHSPLAPTDLTVTLAASPTGARALGDTFSWKLTVSNSGPPSAAFASGQVLLLDNLPAGPIYGTPIVVETVNATNGANITCNIAGNALTCMASGATVTLGPSGGFSVIWSVRPSVIGKLVNPPVGGICEVDPGNVVPESNEGNNSCTGTVVVDYMSASLVLGQPDFTTYFTSYGATVTQNAMYGPDGVAVDPITGKVFVADTLDNRVLRFGSVVSLTNGANAEGVLGQPNFTTGVTATTQSGMWHPNGVHVDAGGRLWVADVGNSRVLRFDQAASKDSGAPANGVLGQPSFTTVVTATTQSTMYSPSAVYVDAAGRLWVADYSNSRVLRFDDAADKADGANADGVLGQPDFTSHGHATAPNRMSLPTAIWVDATGHLWVGDHFNFRVLRFDNAANKPNGADADGVLGQPNLWSADILPASQSTIRSPYGLTGDPGGRLYVSDGDFYRIVWFDDAAAKPNGANADGLLGQPDWTSWLDTGGISGATLNGPAGIFYDPLANVLWVADSFNDRVLRFWTPSFHLSLPLVSR